MKAGEGEQNEGTWELVSDAEEAEGAADEDWNHDGEVDSNATLWDSPASSERSNPFSNPQRRRPRFYRTSDDSSVQMALTELTERVVNPRQYHLEFSRAKQTGDGTRVA